MQLFFSFQSCNTYLFTFFKLKLLLLAYPDKVLCCVVVSLVFFIQGMIPLKQRVIQTKMYISLAPYRVGQFTSKIKSKKLHINQALISNKKSYCFQIFITHIALAIT